MIAVYGLIAGKTSVFAQSSGLEVDDFWSYMRDLRDLRKSSDLPVETEEEGFR